MPLFEVFIPTTDPDGFNITARIRADSWIQALRNGLSKLGDTADVRNVMCDITETGIDVTEPTSGRVFRIRELPEEGAASAAAPLSAVGAAPPPAVGAASPPAVVAAPPPPVAAPLPAGGAAPPPAVVAAPPPAVVAAPPPAVVAAPPPAVVAAPPPPVAAPPPAVVAAPPRAADPVAAPPRAADPVAPSQPAAQVPAAQRFQSVVEEETITQEKASAADLVRIGRVKEEEKSIDDLIGDLFEATQALYDQEDIGAAARLILDLAHQTIPSDSGAVFISDINRMDLYFAAATGPKAEDVLKFRVPMGQGIVGFSSQEGVSLAVSDVHKDPRFYATISNALGYETRSILCAPAQIDGRVFGAIELINKKSGSSFLANEVNLLNYLAHEFADYLVNTGQTGE